MAEETQTQRVKVTSGVKNSQLAESTHVKATAMGVSGPDREQVKVGGVKKVSFGALASEAPNQQTVVLSSTETTGKKLRISNGGH